MSNLQMAPSPHSVLKLSTVDPRGRNQWSYRMQLSHSNFLQNQAEDKKKMLTIYDQKQQAALNKVMQKISHKNYSPEQKSSSARTRYDSVYYEKQDYGDTPKRTTDAEVVFLLKPVYHKRSYSWNMSRTNNNAKTLKSLDMPRVPPSLPSLPLSYPETSDEKYLKPYYWRQFPLDRAPLPPMDHPPAEAAIWSRGNTPKGAQGRQRRQGKEEEEDQLWLAEDIRRKEVALKEKLRRTESKLRRIQQERVASTGEREGRGRQGVEMERIKWMDEIERKERWNREFERRGNRCAEWERERKAMLKEAEMVNERRMKDRHEERAWRQTVTDREAEKPSWGEWERKREALKERVIEDEWEGGGQGMRVKDRDKEREKVIAGQREWQESRDKVREREWERRTRNMGGDWERMRVKGGERIKEGEWERRERREMIREAEWERLKDRDWQRDQVRVQRNAQERSQKVLRRTSLNSSNGSPRSERAMTPQARSMHLVEPSLGVGPSLGAGAQLLPCKHCHRSFAAERLERHLKACEKVQHSKRKIFDSSKYRAKGTDLEEFMKTNSRSKTPEPKNSNWRQKHEIFIRSIRQGHLPANSALRPKLSTNNNPDYVACPHCGRRFAPGPAERHIPKCQYIKSRPPPPRRRL